MNTEHHDCKGITIESIRDEVYVSATEKVFELKIANDDASVWYYEQKNGLFGEFMRYITLSSASTNGLFKNQVDGNNALLSYECSQFFKFSMFFTIIMAGKMYSRCVW